MYQRSLAQSIETINTHFPVLLLTGPRQVGKTTLLEMCAEEKRNYVSLDDLDIRSLAQNDPGLFIQTYPPPLIIDEVQYAPNLLSYIKIVVDREKKNGLFWLTGSQKFHLMKGIHESLAGRVAIVDLLGLSYAELNGQALQTVPFLPSLEWLKQAKQSNKEAITIKEVYTKIWRGFFPKVANASDQIRDIFYRSYIQTYIQRDVKDILAISDETTFYNFIGAIAARTGQVLNYANLANAVGIDNKTVKSWLSVLETSGLVYLLKPYHNNLNKRLIKAPKLYFLDTGLCTYLTKWPTPDSLEVGAMSGAILETYLFTELLKSYWHNGIEPYFYYYRDKDKKEVDLIIETGDTLYPIEFKKTATPSKTATKHFDVLSKLNKKVGHGAVLCFVEKIVPLSKEVTAIPINYI